MATYRYSAAGIEKLVDKAGRQSFVFTGAGVAFAIALVGTRTGWDAVAELWWVFVLFGVATGAYYRYSQRAKVRKTLTALTVTLEEDRLTVDTGTARIELEPAAVRAMRYVEDGVYLRGDGWQRTFYLQDGLETFSELRAALERWVPAEVERVKTGAGFAASLWSIALCPLLVILLAVVVPHPAAAGGLSLLAAVLLTGMFGWVERHPASSASDKWWARAMVPLAAAMVWHGWTKFH